MKYFSERSRILLITVIKKLKWTNTASVISKLVKFLPLLS